MGLLSMEEHRTSADKNEQKQIRELRGWRGKFQDRAHRWVVMRLCVGPVNGEKE